MPNLRDDSLLSHIDYLDGWRGLAITFLLIGHFFPVPGINLGSVGVNLFFVLSGHLMGQLLFPKQTPIPIFYRRRISRIIPAHLFFILCILIFFSLSGRNINLDETLTALLFINNYFPGESGHNQMPFGHIWSLSVEEHSYVILSICAFVCRGTGLGALAAVAGVTLCIVSAIVGYWFLGPSEALYARWLHTEVSGFGIFVSVCLLLYLRKQKLRRNGFMAVPLLVAFGILGHWWSVPRPIATICGVGALALAVNLLHVAPNAVKAFFSIKPLKLMGLWSFSIYLWQQPFYMAGRGGQMPILAAVLLAMACGISSYYCLEKPLRSYLNSTWKAFPWERSAIRKGHEAA